MSKKIDWNVTYKPIKRKLDGKPGNSGYSSGREMLAKAMEREVEQRKIAENFNKAFPALQALLKCRMEAQSEIQIVRDFRYQTSELVHKREWNQDTEDYDGDVEYSSFQDVVKSVPVGTKLFLKSIDPTMQEFIFLNQNGEEVAIPFAAKMQLMTQTDIYETTINFINERGE